MRISFLRAPRGHPPPTRTQVSESIEFSNGTKTALYCCYDEAGGAAGATTPFAAALTSGRTITVRPFR